VGGRRIDVGGEGRGELGGIDLDEPVLGRQQGRGRRARRRRAGQLQDGLAGVRREGRQIDQALDLGSAPASVITAPP
jgi:hypothetical protein